MSEPQCRVHEWHRANRSTYVRTDGRTNKCKCCLSLCWLAILTNWNEMETKSKQRYVCSLARSLTGWQQCFFCLAFGTREKECVSEWHSRSNLLLWCSSTNQNVCSSPKCKTRIHFFWIFKNFNQKKTKYEFEIEKESTI